MNDHKNPAGESGFFSLFTLAVAALAICTASAAVFLMPSEATSQVSVSQVSTAAATVTPDTSTNIATAYKAQTGYFPYEFDNQAKEIEPQPATF